MQVQIDTERGVQLDLPGPVYSFPQPAIRRTALVIEAKVLGEHHLARVLLHSRSLIDLQAEREDPFIPSAKQGQRPMRRDLTDCLAVIEIVGEFSALLLFACN